MGHVLNYTIGDVVAHLRRRRGYRVLRPMGYDAFGLPAENAAIRDGAHPRISTERNIVAIREQMRRMGWAIDWAREISTHEPEYYRWTQWLFLRFYERGLAYRKEGLVNWCPVDQTVLANEQVIDGHCERCGAEVEAKTLTQWYFKITDYADALLDEMELLEQWPERVLTMQRNWIGRSEGARVIFRVAGSGEELPVFTTRPDTLFGATFFVLAPEHPLVPQLDRLRRGARVRSPCRRALGRRAREEGEGRRLHGPLRDQPGQRRGDPDLGRRLRADGVRHRRDHGRSRARRARLRLRRKYGLPIRHGRAARRRRGARGRARTPPHTENEVLVNSGEFDGLPAPEAKKAIVDVARRARPGRRRRSATACATGCSRASATGARRSRSSTASAAASCPCPTTSCRWCCPRSRSSCRRAARRWRRPRTGSTSTARAAAARRSARRTRWTRSSTRPGTSSATRDPTNDEEPFDARDRRLLAAGQPVHRRRRARDPAPALRALLHEGDARHGPRRLPRAVRAPLQPGDDPQGRREDVQVEGQHRRSPRLRRPLRRRRGPDVHALPGPGRPGHGVARLRDRGRLAVPEQALAGRARAGREAARRAAVPARSRRRRTRRSRR